MKLRILCFLFFGACVCKATPVPLNSDEQEARDFAQNASLNVYQYYNDMNQAIIVFESTNNTDDKALMDAYLIIARKMRDIFNASKEFDDEKFTDPKLKYAFKKLRESTREFVLDDETILDMSLSMSELRGLASYTNIPAYHNESIELSFYPDIEEILIKSKNPEELKYYWIKWREMNGADGFEELEFLVETRTEAANIIGLTPLKFFLKEYNLTEMENIMIQIEPLYIQLHGFIRKQLHKKYGDEVIKTNEPIPHHLFEQVLTQVWTSRSVIEEMYPLKDFLSYDEILKQKNYDALKMYKTADQFYKSLGFDSVPDEYWGNNLKEYPLQGNWDCRTEIFDRSPNVSMRYCGKMDFMNFLQAHSYMSYIYFAREKVNLPSYFYLDSYSLKYPVGKAVILSASTPKHLENIGLLTESRFTEELNMNRLLRSGIHTLLNLPVYFVHNNVMADLFSGSVNITEINKHYWKLMRKYVGTAPPVDHGLNGFDFPPQFYTEFLFDHHPNKFMAEVLGYQFFEKLCEISGQYSKSIKSEPINQCDFYGSKKVGDALKKMMPLGSSKPMREVLATIFPENQNVNAESFLEYYAPMKSWLIERNRQNDAFIGWHHVDEEVSTVKSNQVDD